MSYVITHDLWKLELLACNIIKCPSCGYLRSILFVVPSCQNNFYKTGVINDPLGQIHSLASSEHCFRFILFC